jgi:hypothetical protein
LRPRSKPGRCQSYPADLAVEEFLRDAPAVLGGGNGNGRVGVQVVDVVEGQKGVQRGVDGGRLGVEVENAVVEQLYHFVFEGQAPVPVLEGVQAVEVEAGQPAPRQRAQVAARALDPHDPYGLPRERIGFGRLATGVAAPVVGQAQVGAQQVGTVQQQGYFISGQAGRFGFVPQVRNVFKRNDILIHIIGGKV